MNINAKFCPSCAGKLRKSQCQACGAQWFMIHASDSTAASMAALAAKEARTELDELRDLLELIAAEANQGFFTLPLHNSYLRELATRNDAELLRRGFKLANEEIQWFSK